MSNDRVKNLAEGMASIENVKRLVKRIEDNPQTVTPKDLLELQVAMSRENQFKELGITVDSAFVSATPEQRDILLKAAKTAVTDGASAAADAGLERSIGWDANSPRTGNYLAAIRAAFDAVTPRIENTVTGSFGGNALAVNGVPGVPAVAHLVNLDVDQVSRAQLAQLPARVEGRNGADSPIVAVLRKTGQDGERKIIGHWQSGTNVVFPTVDGTQGVDLQRDAEGNLVSIPLDSIVTR